jgi:hypothetical protein
MHSAVRRKKRVPTRAIWLAAVGTALFVHGTVLGAADGIGFGLMDKFAATDKPAAEEVYVDLETSCEGDVLLASSARAAMCLAPWNRDSAECANLSDQQMIMWMDLSACRAQKQDAIAAVSMATVQPREIEKVTPIDAEALLEQLDKTQPPPPPPPPPPPAPPTRPSRHPRPRRRRSCNRKISRRRHRRPRHHHRRSARSRSSRPPSRTPRRNPKTRGSSRSTTPTSRSRRSRAALATSR